MALSNRRLPPIGQVMGTGLFADIFLRLVIIFIPGPALGTLQLDMSQDRQVQAGNQVVTGEAVQALDHATSSANRPISVQRH